MTGNPELVFAASRIGMHASARNSRIWSSVHGPVRRSGDECAEFIAQTLARPSCHVAIGVQRLRAPIARTTDSVRPSSEVRIDFQRRGGRRINTGVLAL